eukprot:124948-Pyramimonas_sp.AAC.1
MDSGTDDGLVEKQPLNRANTGNGDNMDAECEGARETDVGGGAARAMEEMREVELGIKNDTDMNAEITTQVQARVAPISKSVSEIRETKERQAGVIRQLQLQMRTQNTPSDNSSLESTRASVSGFQRPYVQHIPTWVQISGFCK